MGRTRGEIKRLLICPQALGLPDRNRQFNPFVCEKNIALGILTQIVRYWPRLVAYLSEQLDGTRATVTFVKEANILTLGQAF